MKVIKLFIIIAFVSLCGGLTSCEKDDTSLNKDLLIGEWVHSWSKGYEIDKEDPEYNAQWDESAIGDNQMVIFDADGTGYFIEPQGNDPFNWRVEGDMLVLSDGVEIETMRILSLGNQEFILEFHEIEPDYEYYNQLTYSKVK